MSRRLSLLSRGGGSGVVMGKVGLGNGRRGLTTTAQYCQDLVRKQDYENYLVSLFFPCHLRPGYYALRAFNLETASIKDLVSNTDLGRMRLMFWRDAIDTIYKDQPSQHPVIVELHKALKYSKLSSGFFKRIISERETNLTHDHFHTIDDMVNYSENTASSLLYLQLELLNVQDVTTDHIISHIGKGVGMTTLLRSYPYHISKKVSIIPSELMAKYKLSVENLYRDPNPTPNTNSTTTELQDALFEIATNAHQHLLKAEAMLESQPSQIPPRAFPAFLTMTPSRNYLRTFESVQFDPYHPTLNLKSWRLPLQLWYQAYRRKF